jgi:hypothetical protein
VLWWQGSCGNDGSGEGNRGSGAHERRRPRWIGGGIPPLTSASFPLHQRRSGEEELRSDEEVLGSGGAHAAMAVDPARAAGRRREA